MPKEKFNISFKYIPFPTGLAGVGYSKRSINIKVNKKVVGCIDAPNYNTPDNLYRLRFQVIKKDINEDGNPNCTWRWMFLKKKFETSDEAKEYTKLFLKKFVVDNKQVELWMDED